MRCPGLPPPRMNPHVAQLMRATGSPGGHLLGGSFWNESTTAASIAAKWRIPRSRSKRQRPRTEGARTSGVTCLIVVVPAMEPWRAATPPTKAMWDCGNGSARGYSAGATAGAFSFSTALTRTAITAVATTKPSAMTAVVARTRPKPPRPYRIAITETAAPETRKVRK